MSKFCAANFGFVNWLAAVLYSNSCTSVGRSPHKRIPAFAELCR